MFKKYSSLVISFLLGAVLFSATPLKAASDIINAYFNNDQKVTVNGVDKKIQFLNASDTNYGKIRDIVSAIGGTTNYDEATQTIEIVTNENTAASTPIPVIKAPEIVQPTPTPDSSAKITETPDGITRMYEQECKYYIPISEFNEKYHKSTGYFFNTSYNTETINFNKENKILIENVPFILVSNRWSIEYDYYVKTILPIVQQGS